MTTAISAFYQPKPEADWKPAEVVTDHPSGGLVLREVGKFYRGVWLAGRDQVRISEPEVEPGERS